MTFLRNMVYLLISMPSLLWPTNTRFNTIKPPKLK
jgi:hypothetical protein